MWATGLISWERRDSAVGSTPCSSARELYYIRGKPPQKDHQPIWQALAFVEVEKP
jgi:hypothetical protein